MRRLGTNDRILAAIAAVVMVAAVGITVAQRDKAPIDRQAKPQGAGQAVAATPVTATPAPGSIAVPAATEQTPAEGAPSLGPGGAVPFDPGTAPVVPSDMTTDQYVTAYFDALVAQDWETAAAMVPRANEGQTTEEFLALLQPYAPESFAIFESAESSEAGTTLVFLFTADNGAWNVEWEWAETSRGLAVRDLTYSRPGGTPCH